NVLSYTVKRTSFVVYNVLNIVPLQSTRFLKKLYDTLSITFSIPRIIYRFIEKMYLVEKRFVPFTYVILRLIIIGYVSLLRKLKTFLK
ncbi:MAG: hypothetical protein ACPL3B_01960, partial [Fervidobacterium sp.]